MMFRTKGHRLVAVVCVCVASGDMRALVYKEDVLFDVQRTKRLFGGKKKRDWKAVYVTHIAFE